MRSPMKRSYALTLAAGLVLAACQASKPQTTWQTVIQSRPDKVASAANPTQAYTDKLHRVLTQKKVEHKVVTYQYRYQTPLRDEAMGTQTVVLYKDDSNPQNPWWLMDERLTKPIWLPGQDVNRQVAFYSRRKVEVVEQKEFSGGAAPAAPAMIAKQTPVVPAGEPAVTRIAKVTPAPTQSAAAPAEPRPFIRPAHFAHATPAATIPLPKPAPADSRYDDIFRRVHGTDYNASSPIDRRKMETLKQAQFAPREPAATRTF